MGARAGTPGGPRARIPAVYVAIAIGAHIAFGSLLAAYAATTPTGTLGILGVLALVFLMLAVTLAYMYNFGRTRPGPPRVRSGPVGIGRGYLPFLMWAVLGFLAILLTLGQGVSPDEFVDFLLAWWGLVAFFVAAVLVWRRQNPPRWA